MIRLMLKVIAILALLLVAIMGVIRLSQPYDDHGLRETLFTPDCSPPCFLGIHPGSTSADQASAILSVHPWVARVGSEFGSLVVDWSDQAPGFLRQSYSDFRVDVQNRIVVRIRVPTNLDFAAALLVLGRPDSIVYTTYFDTKTPNMQLMFIKDGLYRSDGLDLVTVGDCPSRPDQQLRLRVYLYLLPLDGEKNLTSLDDYVPSTQECR